MRAKDHPLIETTNTANGTNANNANGYHLKRVLALAVLAAAANQPFGFLLRPFLPGTPLKMSSICLWV